ncbi:unnamed protein product [Rotaria magnacalcarata]|uniref:G-protein coupled receptors family 2 profile 2 domain-containing protein n=2 Tax=Rotaria magnacalcarata TaxID=392030 RepID=A0A816N8T1_9BILA|nr:unnamed protein product [Rotaria magnacalcarata]
MSDGHLNTSSSHSTVNTTLPGALFQQATSTIWSTSSITTTPMTSVRNFAHTRTTAPVSSPLDISAWNDSNCFCVYDRTPNLVECSPMLRNQPPIVLSNNTTQINMTLTSCIFNANRFTLPTIENKPIDRLHLMDVNRGGYLVFDATSFSAHKISHISIEYNYDNSPTKLLISNEAFSQISIKSKLRKLSFKNCYLITLKKSIGELVLLFSIELTNIHGFSWYDFLQEIKGLRSLKDITIDEINSTSINSIFNVLSCQDILPQWNLTFLLIQTCSCEFMEFLKATPHNGSIFQCTNEAKDIHIRDDVCRYNGSVYEIKNRTEQFCKQCLSSKCSDRTFCTEANDFKSDCVSPSRFGDASLLNPVPMTSYTKPFIFQGTQQYLTINTNKSLEPGAFYSIATILIEANQIATENSPTVTRMFHETFTEMLNKPWTEDIFSLPIYDTEAAALLPSATVSSTTESPPTNIWQGLIISLDRSMKNILDNISKFEYYSKPISAMSLRFLAEQQPKETFGWKITNDNRIISNITDEQSTDKTVTSRVFLNFHRNQTFEFTCNVSNPLNDCTNRYSITTIKAQRLFYKTDRIPQYDVISVVAPTQNQSVTFFFDQKVSSNDISDRLSNQINVIKVDPFYDKLGSITIIGTCMYLNTTAMIWETDGCLTDRKLSNSTSVTCTCEHLTMFTVFFSLTCAPPSISLAILNWIGCILSIVGLSITLVMFIIMSLCRQTKYSMHGASSSTSSSSQEFRRRTMNKPPHLSIVKSMLLILCLLLILMNTLIFILTFVKPGRNLRCTLLSALLYYFTLTAFIWKLLFALQQSLFLTNIWKIQWSDQTLFTIYSILTFAIPVIPLYFMFIKYEDEIFISSTCDYCWLSREFLLYGLIIPILVIICFNIMFYLYTMLFLCIRNREQVGLRSTRPDQSRRIQNIKIGLFFAIIMGFSWILGFLVLIPNSYVQFIGNILFCIVNAFQGFAFSIMVFFMIEQKSFIRSFRWFWKREKERKIISHSQSIMPQESLPTSNDNDTIKIKNRFNSSTRTTSITSSGDNNTLEIYDHYRNRKLLTEQEIEEDEDLYSSPTF